MATAIWANSWHSRKTGLGIKNGDLIIKYGPKLEISHDLTINDEQWGFKQL
jgi:hypothetical protein